MATLIVLQGPDKGRTLRTDDPVVLIGRGSREVPLSDQTVSRRHAELRSVADGWMLVDLNSANGTYVNGVRLDKPVRLKRGDQIRLGGTLLVYAGDDSTEQLAGRSIPQDLVRLDAGSLGTDASIMASVPSNEDSVVLAAPETAYAVKSWKVMRELSDAIGSLLPPEPLLARVMDIIFEEVEVDRGVLFMFDEESQTHIPEVVRFRGRRARGETPPGSILTSRTIINHVVQSREGVLCSNVVSDQRFGAGKSVQNIGMRSIVCAPIMARENVLGVIHLDCPVTRHTYNEHELRLITAIGYQTGLAIENARLVQSHLQRERLAAAGETVAYLSHYIKNILQGMRSGADVVQRGIDRRDFAVTSQGWRMVERNLEKAYHLMLNMLAFSKERQPRLELLHVNRIVNDVVALVQRQADDKSVVLLTDLDDNIPPLPTDYDGVHQVLLNLLSNAIDAVARETGMIHVRTRYEGPGREIVLSVTDNGPGIPPDQRPRVFEAFHSTKGHGGTGLGLAVADKIIRELGGTLTLADASEGGANFEVRLPTTDERTISPGDTQGPA